MPVNRYINNYPSKEQISNEYLLMEDIIVESIQMMGHNVWYIPRESFDEGDMVFGEYAKSAFNKAYMIEAYLLNVNSHGGQQDFFSKFGLEIKDEDSFVISRRSFRNIIPGTIRQRPQEGDLVYVPVLHKMYEIKFIEQELMFHSIGKRLPFCYEMKCEAFRASQEPINTGVNEIDQVGLENSFTMELIVDPYNAYDPSFLLGETVFQSNDDTWANRFASATVKEWFAANNTLMLYNIVGQFSNTANIIGTTSNAIYSVVVSDNLTDFNYYDLYDNKKLNTDAEEILDFSEHNPFGTP